jgi:hypothetical protein
MNIMNSNNAKLLGFLRHRVEKWPDRSEVKPSGEPWDEVNSARPPAFVSFIGVQKPYRRIFLAHPEAVERVWDELGSALPRDCRAVVYRAPALVHPDSGIIFALVLGTYYALRLPSGSDREDVVADKIQRRVFRPGTDLDAKRDLGDDWILGKWLKRESDLCLSTYEELSDAQADADRMSSPP